MFTVENGALLRRFARESLLIEPWGQDALRMRGTMYAEFGQEHWALDTEPPRGPADIHIDASGNSASIRNGEILARIDPRGQVSFYNGTGKLLLANTCVCASGTCRLEPAKSMSKRSPILIAH